jgi:uncharacterized membrane protein
MKQLILTVSLVFSILLLSGNALALGLEYYGVEVTINDDVSVHNTIVLEFDTPINHLDYNLDFEVENLEFESDFEFADCTVENNGGSTISCDFIGMTNENNQLKLDFDTRDVIKEADDNYRFIVNYGVPLPIQSTFVLIRLPQNNILAGQTNESYFPQSGSILSDGKRIMVFWEEEKLPSGENLQFSVLFTRPMMNIEFLDYLVYLTAIIAVVLIALGILYVRRRGTKVAVVKSVLNKDEKKVIDILNNRGGKAGQKVLVRETDFSKAKVSRIVKSLKDRGVVDTEPISGRENRVMLILGKKESPD